MAKDTQNISIVHSKKTKPIKNKSTKFSQQEVELTATPLFFPEGYEQLFLAIYFISLPYIAGLFFQFFYISDSNVDIFLTLNNQSHFILTWAIGYEIIATVILLYIIKMALTFANENRKQNVKTFKRP